MINGFSFTKLCLLSLSLTQVTEFLYLLTSTPKSSPYDFLLLVTEAYSEPCQTCNMEHFAKLANSFYSIFAKRSTLDAWQSPEYAFG